MTAPQPTADPAVDPATDPVVEPAADPAAPADLGDAGKKAIDAMKAKWQAERDRAKALDAELAELKKPKAGEVPDADSIRAEALAEATAKVNARIIGTELRSAAKGKLADPADAKLYLDLSQFEVDADGNVDEAEMNDAIDELLKRKPHLAAQGRRFQGDADAGPRTGAALPQVTQSELDRMSPAQVQEARKAGRLNALMGTGS